MTNLSDGEEVERPVRSNGSGAAAVLAAGIGAFAMAVFAILADHSAAFGKLMIFYTPTGRLSGVTTTSIAVWIACWIGLDAAWKQREIQGWAMTAGIVLIAISFVLMFPPVGDLF